MFELHPQLAQDCIELAELKLCKVLLMNDSQYPWLILVPMNAGIREVIELDEQQQSLLWRESATLSRVLQSMYSPDKLNIAALGNMVPQLHIHHIARFHDDPAWPAPVWGRFPPKPYLPEDIVKIKSSICQALKG